MIKDILIPLLRMFLWLSGMAQAMLAQAPGWSGQVKDASTLEAVQGVSVHLEGRNQSFLTDSKGRFKVITSPGLDSVTCLLQHPGYQSKQVVFRIRAKGSGPHTILLHPLSDENYPERIISLTEADIFDEEVISGSSDFLQASRDLFLSRVAFDFSPAFFRLRGFDSRYGQVFLNDIPMNRFYDGRPQWNNWGGLNDALRNQRFYLGCQVGPSGFGSLVGVSNIDVHPSGTREGFRFTTSVSDRNYRYRLMGTYNSGIRDNGWGITLSASKRFARETFVEGTPYDASSFLLSVGFEPSDRHVFSLLGIYAANYRGRSVALTEEVLELGGRTYNPYWGIQDGKIRNSRIRFIREPLVNFRYQYRGNSFSGTFAAAYQWGTQYRTRLAYFNAPNPDPAYYRNLPSFYWNGTLGPNLLNADAARKEFALRSQIVWEELYSANRNRGPVGSAAYLLHSDRSDEQQFSLNAHLSMKLGRRWLLRSGILFRNSRSGNYARLEDLLGAKIHQDTDPFTNTRNNLGGELEKTEGDRFGYHYLMVSGHWEAFASLETSFNKWDAYLAGSYSSRDVMREGLYQNARYPDHSLGRSTRISLPMGQVKAGFSYRMDGRNRLQAAIGLLQAPPGIRNLYVNPRDHSGMVPSATPERILATEITYQWRGPKLTTRMTGYYNRLQDRSEVNFFFSETGYGSAFVQEVATGLDVLHKGLELGVKVALGPSVAMSGVMALGDHRYASDPDIVLFHVPGAGEGKLPNMEGSLSLGTAELRKRFVSGGPSRAFSLGVDYRAPAFWWTAVTANYLAGHYPDLSLIRYTDAFRRDPETGQAIGINESDFQKVLRQRPLPPVYLLNLTAGKSWKKGPHYVSLFLSVVNLFDRPFYSGGYQQGRNGNYLQWTQDHLGGSPSFGTKFWPGAGRTFFANLSWSFH